MCLCVRAQACVSTHGGADDRAVLDTLVACDAHDGDGDVIVAVDAHEDGVVCER